MRAIFVVDASSNERSPLVQRLMREGYLVLSLADCQHALEVLRCLLPDLMIVDVAAIGVHAAVGMPKALASGAARPLAPVLITGAKLVHCRELEDVLSHGEVIPAIHSTPDEVLARVRHYLRPGRPPHDDYERAVSRGNGIHDDDDYSLASKDRVPG